MDPKGTGGMPQGGSQPEPFFARQANKGTLVGAIGDDLKVPRRTAARILDAVLDSISDLLRGRGKVAVKGFGTFERRIPQGRANKLPSTGEVIDVSDRETIVFKPSADLVRNTKQPSGVMTRLDPSVRDRTGARDG